MEYPFGFRIRIAYDRGVSTAPLRADAARNRARVLAAARAALAGGDTALPLNEIARRAGVGVGTVYRHFPNRQALLEAVVDEQFDRLLEQVRVAEADPDPGAGLARIVRAAVLMEIGDPGFAEVLAAPDDAGAGTAAKKAELASTCERVLARACATGAVRPDLTPADVQRLVCGIGYAARLGGDEAGGAPRDRAGRYVDLVVAGMRP
jgi:AcrR family transcriptional regulator